MLTLSRVIHTEFVALVWNICSLNDYGVVDWCVSMFDLPNRNGILRVSSPARLAVCCLAVAAGPRAPHVALVTVRTALRHKVASALIVGWRLARLVRSAR